MGNRKRNRRRSKKRREEKRREKFTARLPTHPVAVSRVSKENKDKETLIDDRNTRMRMQVKKA